MNKIDLTFDGFDSSWKNDGDEPVMVTDVFVEAIDPAFTVHVYKILEPGDTLRLAELPTTYKTPTITPAPRSSEATEPDTPSEPAS